MHTYIFKTFNNSQANKNTFFFFLTNSRGPRVQLWRCILSKLAKLEGFIVPSYFLANFITYSVHLRHSMNHSRSYLGLINTSQFVYLLFNLIELIFLES